MAAKLTRLTYKIVTLTHFVAQRLNISILGHIGELGNIWIRLRIAYVLYYLTLRLHIMYSGL
jgi:hypothetical protein